MHAVLQRVLKLAWRVQDGYLGFYFSPGSVHCPWKVEISEISA